MVAAAFGDPVRDKLTLGGDGGGVFDLDTHGDVTLTVTPATAAGPPAAEVADALAGRAQTAAVLGGLPASSRAGHLRATLLTLSRLTPRHVTNVSKPLHQLADSLSKRGMVVLISDLLDDPASVIRGLKHFQFRGTDVLVFQVLDPDEIDFPFDRATRFDDLETGEEISAVPGAVRVHYLREIGSLIERYRRELGASGIDYQLLRTDRPLELALMSYLTTRARGL